jgi:predicted dithiol-disulfide oxidoreductase (DUF899 family)
LFLHKREQSHDRNPVALSQFKSAAFERKIRLPSNSLFPDIERQGTIMVKEMIDGTYRQTNLTNESAEYLSKREEVRLAEIELMRARERVAELRRALPKGAELQDYEFLDCSLGALPIEHPTRDARAGTPLGQAIAKAPASLSDGNESLGKVRLSELFTAPDRSLVIYHFMFGKKQTTACPMCTAWIDGCNGVAHHLAQTTDFAIVAAADPAALRAYARERGWDKLRLLSAGESTFKYDLGSEDREGNQDSEISVFTRDSDSTLRHFYSGHPWLDTAIKERGIDELSPIWNVLDLTPQGRGKFYTSLDYGTNVQIARR